MIIALALVVASVTEAPPDVVRVKPRPDLPWVTAVFAPHTATVDDKRIKAAAPALSDIGVSIRVEQLDGFDVVVVEGPPEAHDAIVKAARTSVPSGGVLFVDGRTTLVEKGALPSRTLTTPKQVTAPTQLRQPLASSPGLLDVEGEALALFVEGIVDALDLGVVDARVTASALIVEAHASALVDGACTRGAHDCDSKPQRERARAALDAAVSTPIPSRRVEELRTKARAIVAERRARAGGWARDMALMWLAHGTLDVEEPKDLGSALRARVFPSVLLR
jgi:hypothetical protein